MNISTRAPLTLLALGCLCITTGEQACAEDVTAHVADVPAARYYAMIFGSESVPKRAKYTHTWATLVKATTDPADPETQQFEVQTISWLPRNGNVRVLALRAECGKNFSLDATLRDCFSKCECVVMWGPYEIDPARAVDVYGRFCAQVARLNSGCMLYKAIDPDHGPRSTYICDCIHAVTDLDRHLARPFYNEFRNVGLDAGRQVVQILASRDRINLDVTHEWVAQALKLDPRVNRGTIR